MTNSLSNTIILIIFIITSFLTIGYANTASTIDDYWTGNWQVRSDKGSCSSTSCCCPIGVMSIGGSSIYNNLTLTTTTQGLCSGYTKFSLKLSGSTSSLLSISYPTGFVSSSTSSKQWDSNRGYYISMTGWTTTAICGEIYASCVNGSCLVGGVSSNIGGGNSSILMIVLMIFGLNFLL